jgi:hypothetical protein
MMDIRQAWTALEGTGLSNEKGLRKLLDQGFTVDEIIAEMKRRNRLEALAWIAVVVVAPIACVGLLTLAISLK